MRLGRDFDLRLQEFSADPAGGQAVGGVKKRFRSLCGNLECLAIGKKIFFLDAELKQLAWRKDARLALGRNERTDVKPPFEGIESKFHALVPDCWSP